MTRILAIADPHIDARHLSSLDEQATALAEVVRIVAEQKVELVLIAGDVTHTNRPRPDALAIIGQFLSSLERLAVQVVVIPGNHDPDVAAIAEHFRGKITTILEPGVVRVPVRGGFVMVAGMPYLPDRHVRATLEGDATKEQVAIALTAAARQITESFLAQRVEGTPLVFLGHGTVAGSTTSSGWNMGFIPGTEWQLDADLLAEFDLAIVGHIHRHQSPRPNVVVPGSLLPLDFAESEAHGVILADVGGKAGRAGVKWRFWPVTLFDVSTWDVDGGPELAALMNPANGGSWSVSTGERIRVRVTCSEEQARETPPAAIEAALRARGAALVQVELVVERAARGRDEAMRSDLSPTQALTRWVATTASLDPERTRAMLEVCRVQLAEMPAWEGAAMTGDLDLVRLEAHDFLGLKDADVRLGSEIATLSGPVGSGKSALGADIVRFALFGTSRVGTTSLARLVRSGADLAVVAVELATPAGARYRIVRKIKVDGRGRPASTLDVLRHIDTHGGTLTGWAPMSETAKIAAGESAIARLLGGLTDPVLTVANLVVQRDADGWTADAKPEERRRLLAAAAGLGVYDELAQDARTRSTASQRRLEPLEAVVAAARPRADGRSTLEARVAEYGGQAVAVQETLGSLSRRVEDVERSLQRERERLGEWDRIMADAKAASATVADLEGQRIRWNERLTEALAVKTTAPDAERHRQAVLAVAELETRQDAEARTAQEIVRLTTVRHDLERQRSALYAVRERDKGVAFGEVMAAGRAAETLKDSRCPVLEQITSGALHRCRFLESAGDASALEQLRQNLHALEDPGQEEERLRLEAEAVVIPKAPDTAAIRSALMRARAAVESLEAEAEHARDRASRARQTIDEHKAATADLEKRIAKAQKENSRHAQTLVGFGGSPSAAVTRLTENLRVARVELEESRADLARVQREIATAEADLRHAIEAANQVERGEAEAKRIRADVATLVTLADAWKAVRVMVLENEVIPAVEEVANDILGRFPYGLQLALRTQRARAGSDLMSEALDVEVLGGLGSVYELCSGGQRTTIDLALHVAIALIVSRRATTRLRYLFIDEPEGLDEPGRAALAGIVRWTSETFGLRVLVASHHADLIDAISGDSVVIGGEPGAAIVAHGRD